MERKEVYEQAINDVLAGMSYPVASQKHQVNRGTLWRLVMKRKLPEAVEMLNCGSSIENVSEKLHLPVSTLKRYLPKQPAGSGDVTQSILDDLELDGNEKTVKLTFAGIDIIIKRSV